MEQIYKDVTLTSRAIELLNGIIGTCCPCETFVRDDNNNVRDRSCDMTDDVGNVISRIESGEEVVEDIADVDKTDTETIIAECAENSGIEFVIDPDYEWVMIRTTFGSNGVNEMYVPKSGW